MADKKKLKPDKDGKVYLTKKQQYTLAEWRALTADERLEIVARALGLIK